ncbi:MAG: rhodoquinone biosynthesis methyltransferase RquA [Alphaproteobacteria bacterium]|nr:rhodoquinone biosynthesis methyltransferase RquA [Alphaproteobacteria bacterium]
MNKTSNSTIPVYIKNIYSWLYLKPFVYSLFDNPFVLNILTLGYHHILSEELKKEIIPHSHILQVGVTLGSQIEKTYQALGTFGSYTIVDVLPKILKKCQEKHLERRLNLVQANASKTIKGEYDTIICYMLLHELPPITKNKLLQNISKSLKPNGKIIFIDYHLPSPYNPLKYFIRAVNRLYQPFAESLWKKSIKEIMPDAEQYSWSKQTYFGGVYQKVVATKYK